MLRQVDGENGTEVERQRYRRGDVLAASGEELILKFSPCAVLPGISQNCFLNSTLLSCFGVGFFYGGVARFTVRVVYPWQREQLPWKFGSSVVPRWSVRCFFFLRAGTGGHFSHCDPARPRLLVGFYRKFATLWAVVTGAVRGSGATPDNSGRGEGRSCSQEAGGAALLVVLVAAVVVGGDRCLTPRLCSVPCGEPKRARCGHPPR